MTAGAALRTHPTLVPRQIVPALLAMPRWDAASVPVPEDGGGEGDNDEGEPKRQVNCDYRRLTQEQWPTESVLK